MIDVVYKVGNKSKWGSNHEELRYSIRSVVKNFKNLGKIVIIGTKPDWFTGQHIFCDDPFRKNKDANIINKLIIAANQDWITTDFVNISDDQLILHPITTEFLKPYTINSDLRRMENHRGISEYGYRIRNTITTLKKEGLPTNLYEGHVPYLLNKEKFKEILSKYDYVKGKGMCSNTLYFNNLLNFGEYPVENVRGFLKKPSTPSQIISECKGKLFFGYQRRALNNNLKEFLKNKFNEKTIYEQ